MVLVKKISKNGFYGNCFFLGAICLIFIIGIFTFVKKQEETSTVENRTLAMFQHFTIKDFLKGGFQDKLEDAISDQFVLSGAIRTIYGKAITSFPTFGLEKIICDGRYLDLPSSDNDGSKYGTFNCEDYILRMPRVIDAAKQKNLQQNIENLNHLNSLTKAYYYVINNSSEYNFEKDELVTDFRSIFERELKGQKGLSSLKCDNYETYKKYFYKTDLHWNYLGSYQGFLDITEMLGIDNPATPTGIYTNEEYYFGSHAKHTQKRDSLENFTVYTFDIPKHDTIIEGDYGREYSNVSGFVNHDYKSSKLDFYAYAYGKNYGEIIFDYHQPKKENLLIVADSFSNPLNELIAQYFNKTFVVDLRYYNNAMGSQFVLSDYLKTNDIDCTLLIISSEYFITKANATKGLEK